MPHEFDGKKYEKASTHQREWGAKIISKLGLKGSESVLDLGCGDGILSLQIADLVPKGEVIGIDASQGMIDAALPKERDNLRFQRMDINHLDFVERFDIVFSNATLHWIKDHERLLQNVRRVLRPGGRVRFNFAGDGNCSNFITVIREAMAQEKYRAFFQTFEWPWYMPSVGEYRDLADSSGLHEVQVWGENADRFFPDKEAMIRWIDQPSLAPFLVHVADCEKESFRSFVVGMMIEKTKQKDGSCFETFRRINLSASK
ncbi:methyltransferase domain-containing protein [Candidatus Sumerlaeota bacterium]|nr:methyltransferase domain-containing protein [Candidatus Sumerlaeota bacterium]